MEDKASRCRPTMLCMATAKLFSSQCGAPPLHPGRVPSLREGRGDQHHPWRTCCGRLPNSGRGDAPLGQQPPEPRNLVVFVLELFLEG